MGDVIGIIRVPPDYNKPLKPLPNPQCYTCEKEIEGRIVWVRRMYACHPGHCTTEARNLMRDAQVGTEIVAS